MSMQRTIRRNFGEMSQWIDNSRRAGQIARKKLEKERKKQRKVR
jgi:hypothetical protein